MKTRFIKIDEPSLSRPDIERAAELLCLGGLVVIPTETVYGLGGDGTNPESAKRIYAAKGRPSDNPLIIHIAEPEDADRYAVTSPLYYELARAFMPGPLTVIMKKRENIPYEVTGGLDTVAVRCPSHPVAQAIIKAARIPIAAPSANISGKPSPTSSEHVRHDLDGKVDMIIDGGECEIGLESTIVMIDGESSVTLLRPGAVTYDALCCVCDKVKLSPAMEGVTSEDERPLSPGMKYKHYAPSAPLVLLDGNADDILNFVRREKKEKRCIFLCYDEEAELLKGAEDLITQGKKEDMASQARMLFDSLRRADKLCPDIIYAHLPPRDGLGLALYNRMIRAAAHTIKKV